MDIKEYKRDDSLDYLKVLKALNEIPFPVGKNLLIDFLTGDRTNKSIQKNKLYDCYNFNILDLDKEGVRRIIDNLVNNKLIEITGNSINKFWKVLSITSKGEKELISPSLFKKKVKNNLDSHETIITGEDKLRFKELDNFLSNYNDYQKKAIISQNKKILCIAGAGSGKTTVLTKRIEFLVKYKSANPENILAITFTRKARQEMQERLLNLGVNVRVETFNSFCEKMLKRYERIAYKNSVRVISYAERIFAIQSALENVQMTMESAISKYFSNAQKRNKSHEELSSIFINDCFSVLDYFKIKNEWLYDFSKDVDLKNQENALMIYNVCKYLCKYMGLYGLRDYTDQMIDAIKLFENNKELMPEFDHILVDEYQDVNSAQIKLLEILNPQNLFCVGDPRQSIFGWRGSDINHILNFKEKYCDCEIITLNQNYRSNDHIVKFMNLSIRDLGLSDLKSDLSGTKEIKLKIFNSEEQEHNFVMDKIRELNQSSGNIFVLTRTNRQLSEISQKMKQRSIKHLIKTDKDNFQNQREKIILATIHSIKGLESETVFVLGCNELNFPCKASDHPVIEMIKLEDYDKEEEEKRLFYVAISRAKNKLYLTHTGKHTYFINKEMLGLINGCSLEDF